MLLALGKAHPYNPHTGNGLESCPSSPAAYFFRCLSHGRELCPCLKPGHVSLGMPGRNFVAVFPDLKEQP
jgi:hypothetical protein